MSEDTELGGAQFALFDRMGESSEAKIPNEKDRGEAGPTKFCADIKVIETEPSEAKVPNEVPTVLESKFINWRAIFCRNR